MAISGNLPTRLLARTKESPLLPKRSPRNLTIYHIIARIRFGQADVWNTVHELTEAYHEAHPDVTEKKRATHVCTAPGCWLVMKSYKKITKDGGIIWISV